jgi:hypothetical protein
VSVFDLVDQVLGAAIHGEVEEYGSMVDGAFVHDAVYRLVAGGEVVFAEGEMGQAGEAEGSFCVLELSAAEFAQLGEEQVCELCP